MSDSSLPEILAMLRAKAEQAIGCHFRRVILEGDDGEKLKLALPRGIPADHHPAAAPQVVWRGFSPLEEQILAALADHAWHTGDEIARACGVPRSGAFSAIISNLGETGAVESSTRHGYRLPVADSRPTS